MFITWFDIFNIDCIILNHYQYTHHKVLMEGTEQKNDHFTEDGYIAVFLHLIPMQEVEINC